jgi:endonuclease/exonuclease/phosphatase family metal-dependent hydrolase
MPNNQAAAADVPRNRSPASRVSFSMASHGDTHGYARATPAAIARGDCGRAAIRVMSWNIHGGVGLDFRCDLDRIIALVRRHDPDIVALQEVDSRHGRRRNGAAFESLKEALGSHAAEARLMAAPDGDYGHVLISRWPLSDVVRHDVSVKGREPRAAIEAIVETPSGPLHVVAVHLGLSVRERRRQAALLAAVAQRGPLHSIILGDFNDWRHGIVMRALADAMPARACHKTFPAFWPMLALDCLYARPADIILRSFVDPAGRTASDHLPIVADLLPPGESSNSGISAGA